MSTAWFGDKQLPEWFSEKLLANLLAAGWDAYVIPERLGPCLHIQKMKKAAPKIEEDANESS